MKEINYKLVIEHNDLRVCIGVLWNSKDTFLVIHRVATFRNIHKLQVKKFNSHL